MHYISAIHRAHEEIQYVQRFVTYYFMEAECCDGYKEVMEGNQVKCERKRHILSYFIVQVTIINV